MSKEVFNLGIYFDPLKMNVFVEPYGNRFSKTFDHVVIQKRNGKPFSKEDVQTIEENVANKSKSFDFENLYIKKIKLTDPQKFSFEDYLGQIFSLQAVIRSTESENDKLLHYLYQKVGNDSSG